MGFDATPTCALGSVPAGGGGAADGRSVGVVEGKSVATGSPVGGKALGAPGDRGASDTGAR
jgi:hypothetical protein